MNLFDREGSLVEKIPVSIAFIGLFFYTLVFLSVVTENFVELINFFDDSPIMIIISYFLVLTFLIRVSLFFESARKKYRSKTRLKRSRAVISRIRKAPIIIYFIVLVATAAIHLYFVWQASSGNEIFIERDCSCLLFLVSAFPAIPWLISLKPDLSYEEKIGLGSHPGDLRAFGTEKGYFKLLLHFFVLHMYGLGLWFTVDNGYFYNSLYDIEMYVEASAVLGGILLFLSLGIFPLILLEMNRKRSDRNYKNRKNILFVTFLVLFILIYLYLVPGQLFLLDNGSTNENHLLLISLVLINLLFVMNFFMFVVSNFCPTRKTLAKYLVPTLILSSPWAFVLFTGFDLENDLTYPSLNAEVLSFLFLGTALFAVVFFLFVYLKLELKSLKEMFRKARFGVDKRKIKKLIRLKKVTSVLTVLVIVGVMVGSYGMIEYYSRDVMPEYELKVNRYWEDPGSMEALFKSENLSGNDFVSLQDKYINRTMLDEDVERVELAMDRKEQSDHVLRYKADSRFFEEINLTWDYESWDPSLSVSFIDEKIYFSRGNGYFFYTDTDGINLRINDDNIYDYDETQPIRNIYDVYVVQVVYRYKHTYVQYTMLNSDLEVVGLMVV